MCIAQVTDPVGDFLLTFAGNKGADLDVVSADGTIIPNDSNTNTATMAGAIGQSPGALLSGALTVVREQPCLRITELIMSRSTRFWSLRLRAEPLTI